MAGTNYYNYYNVTNASKHALLARSSLLTCQQVNLLLTRLLVRQFPPDVWKIIWTNHRCSNCYGTTGVVLCDTHDTSILIVDTYVTIPVSPMSRYTAVYRSSKKYRQTAQVSRVSTIPHDSYHSATSNLQAYDAKTNVIKSLTDSQ